MWSGMFTAVARRTDPRGGCLPRSQIRTRRFQTPAREEYGPTPSAFERQIQNPPDLKIQPLLLLPAPQPLRPGYPGRLRIALSRISVAPSHRPSPTVALNISLKADRGLLEGGPLGHKGEWSANLTFWDYFTFARYTSKWQYRH
jgi:hypothetical protein